MIIHTYNLNIMYSSTFFFLYLRVQKLDSEILKIFKKTVS